MSSRKTAQEGSLEVIGHHARVGVPTRGGESARPAAGANQISEIRAADTVKTQHARPDIYPWRHGINARISLTDQTMNQRGFTGNGDDQ